MVESHLYSIFRIFIKIFQNLLNISCKHMFELIFLLKRNVNHKGEPRFIEILDIIFQQLVLPIIQLIHMMRIMNILNSPWYTIISTLVYFIKRIDIFTYEFRYILLIDLDLPILINIIVTIHLLKILLNFYVVFRILGLNTEQSIFQV